MSGRCTKAQVLWANGSSDLRSPVSLMDSRTILGEDIGFYIGAVVWALLDSLHRIHSFAACQKHLP